MKPKTHKKEPRKASLQEASVALLDESRFDVASFTKNTVKVILTLVAVGALIPLAVVVPNLPKALSEIGDIFNRTPRTRARQAFRRLEKQRLIEIREVKGDITVVLTSEGKKRVRRFNLEHLRLQPQGQWDKLWRVIAFDIPEEFNQARRALRVKMRELGFYPLQKSVFVHCYPCREEIDFISDFFGVGKYIHYFEAQYLDDENYLKEHFHLH